MPKRSTGPPQHQNRSCGRSLTEPRRRPQACTPNNVWQLTHRIYHKLLRFIDHGE
jgi:hypothetical protein